MREDIFNSLEQFYDYDVPGYIVRVGKSYMVLNVGTEYDEDDLHPLKIRMEDVVKYYVNEAAHYESKAANTPRNTRTIAGVTGDWRNIEEMANECLRWFRFIDVVQLRRTCKKHGLEPTF